MKKILVKVNNEEELTYPADGYVLGVTRFCICFNKTFNINEINEIIKKNNNKEIYVSLNKPVFNFEVEEYKNLLLNLDKLGLNGIIVGDVAALTYDLKTPIIIDQLHLNNSSLTVKYFLNNGVKGVFLTNDITLDEINKIKDENKNGLLFKQVFGLPHLSSSVRSLVTNYLSYFGKKSNSKVYKIKERIDDDSYFIVEDYFGTHILGSKPINLINELDAIKVDYAIIDGYLLDKKIDNVLKAFLENDVTKRKEIDEAFNSNEGFINRKTIYKVKNDD